MSLFNRKTRFDKAHLCNCWNPMSGDFSLSTDSFSPKNIVEQTGDAIIGTVDKVWDNVIETPWNQMIDENQRAYDRITDFGSEFLGNMTGGEIGTSSEERFQAEQKSAQLNASYEGYGQFRGEMEKAREQNRSISSSVRGQTQAKLASSGILKGSAEWNRRLAAVGNTTNEATSLLDQQWKDYIASSEYGNLVENYELDWSRAYNFDGLDDAERNKMKPTFDEFYSLTRGTDEEKASMKSIFDMRKENTVKMRNS